MRNSLFSVCLICFLGLHTIQAQVHEKLVLSKDGKYVYTVTGSVFKAFEDPIYEGEKYWVRTNKVPVGMNVILTNPVNKKKCGAVVVDSMKNLSVGEEDILQTNGATLRMLYPNTNNFFRKEIQLNYITPLDSLLNIAAKSPLEAKFDRYKKLAERFKKYSPNDLGNLPPMDSLKVLSPVLPVSQKRSLYKFMMDFFAEKDPRKSVKYIKKLLTIYKKEGNKEKEAEYWLRLGKTVNALVDKTQVDYRNSRSLKDPAKIAALIAEKSGYNAKDIIRWNRFGGYFDPNFLSYMKVKFDLYPHPEQLSDKEYLKYLEIRQAQGQKDKIAWALKELGDLYRIKTGYAKAEAYYFKLIKLREIGADKDKLVWVWGYMADFYWEQKKYTQAETYFNKILELRKQTRDYRRVIWALGGLRYLRYSQGKLDEALDYQRQVLKYYEQLNREERGYILSAVVSGYLWAFPDKKELILSYLFKWFEEINSKNKTAQKYNDESKALSKQIANIAQSMGKYELAAEHLARAIAGQKKSLRQLNTINDIAFLYQKARRYKLSKKYYQQGLKNTRKAKCRVLEAIQNYKLGYFYDAQSSPQKAEKYYRNTVKVLQKIDDNSLQSNQSNLFADYVFKGDTYPYLFVTLGDIYYELKRRIQDAKVSKQFLEHCIRITNNLKIKEYFRISLQRN